MRIYTPISILALIIIVVPIIGLPQIFEQIILACLGLAILILIHGVKLFRVLKKHEQTEKEY